MYYFKKLTLLKANYIINNKKILSIITSFDFEIKYIKGSLNKKTDTLSKGLNYELTFKKVKLILKLIKGKLKSFEIIKELNKNKVIKKGI